MGYQVYHMLLHTAKQARDLGYQAFKGVGINPGEAWLLDVTARFGPIKQIDAAAVLNVRLPAVSRMVKGMEEKGLLERVRSQEDERIVLLSASQRGRSLLPVMRSAWNGVEERIMSGFSEEEKLLFKEFLLRIVANAEKIAEEDGTNGE